MTMQYISRKKHLRALNSFLKLSDEPGVQLTCNYLWIRKFFLLCFDWGEMNQCTFNKINITWRLLSWLFPEVWQSCYQFQDQLPEPHRSVVGLPEKTVLNEKCGNIGQLQHIYILGRWAQLSLLAEGTRPKNDRFILPTFSMMPLTTKGFFNMCWPTPVLNIIPEKHQTTTVCLLVSINAWIKRI